MIFRLHLSKSCFRRTASLHDKETEEEEMEEEERGEEEWEMTGDEVALALVWAALAEEEEAAFT